MNNSRFPRLAAVLLLPLFSLASCLDYREELWLNSDGSGKIHAIISVHSELGLPDSGNGSIEPDAIEKQLRDIFAVTEGAEIESYETYDEEKRRVYDFTISFRDLRQLKPALVTGQGNIGAVFGDFAIERIPESKLAVQRTVALTEFESAEPAPSSGEDSLGESIGKALGGLVADTVFGNYHLEYVTHFPSEVVSANSPDIDHETNTVSWRFPLSKATQGPISMTAQIKRPGSWMTWLFVVFAILVTATILLPAFRKKSP